MTVCLETPVIYCADEKVCEKLPKTIVYEFGNLLCRGCHYLVYYESIKRELKIKPSYECRREVCECDAALVRVLTTFSFNFVEKATRR